MTDTSNVSRLFRDIGLDDDEPDSHMVRRHPSGRNLPYRCPCCGTSLAFQPTKRDPETGLLIADACFRSRVKLINAKEEKRQNVRHSVKGDGS